MELHSVETTRLGRPAFEGPIPGAPSGLFDQLLQAGRARADDAELSLRDDRPAPPEPEDPPAAPEHEDPPAEPAEATRDRDADDTEAPDQLPSTASLRDEQPPEAGTTAAADGAIAPGTPPPGIPNPQGQANTALFASPSAAQPAGARAPAAPAAALAPAQAFAARVAPPPIATASPLETPTPSAKPAQPDAKPEAKAGVLQDGAFVQVSLHRGAVVSRPQGTLSGSAPLTTQDLAAGARRQGAAAARPDAVKPAGAARNFQSTTKSPGAHGGPATARQKLAGTNAPASGPTRTANPAAASPQAIPSAPLAAPAVPIVPGVPVTAATTAPAPGTPPATGQQPAPAEQVALRIQKSVTAGQDRISIKLHPAELGRVEVRLELGEDGLVRAALVAERAETLDLLQRDARGLERALQQAGLQLDSGSLSFNLRGGEPRGEDAGKTGGSASSSAEDGDGGESAQAATPGARHDGVLDLFV